MLHNTITVDSTSMSSDGVDAGLINHAVQAMSAAAGGGSIDMASVLAKIQSLEREKQVMAATLESNNARSVTLWSLIEVIDLIEDLHHIDVFCTGWLSCRRERRLRWRF
jgi:hypothetical protein